MANVKEVIIAKNCPVKSDAGLHGKDIGYIWGAVQPFNCSVDFDLEHDRWVPIVNPATWKDTGLQGWVKKANCIIDIPEVYKYIMEVNKDTGEITVKPLG